MYQFFFSIYGDVVSFTPRRLVADSHISVMYGESVLYSDYMSVLYGISLIMHILWNFSNMSFLAQIMQVKVSGTLKIPFLPKFMQNEVILLFTIKYAKKTYFIFAPNSLFFYPMIYYEFYDQKKILQRLLSDILPRTQRLHN